jgi:hypothetical protein
VRTDENQWARLQQRNTKENEIGRRKRSDGFVKLGLQLNDSLAHVVSHPDLSLFLL